MRKRAKLTYLIYLVLVLVLAGNASAVIREWDASDSNLWDEPLNWTPEGVPSAATNDAALIDMNDANCVIDASVVDANSFSTYICFTSGAKPCYVRVNSSTFRTGVLAVAGNHTAAGGAQDCDGFLIANNSYIEAGGDIRVAMGLKSAPADKPTYGTLIINNSDVNGLGGKIYVGKNPYDTGSIYVNGGTLYAGDDIELGNYGTATMVVTAGDVNVEDTIKFAIGGSDALGGTATLTITDGNIYCSEVRFGDAVKDNGTTGYGTIYLDGGDVNCSTINIYNHGKIDITEGTLVVRTDDEVTKIRGYKTDGWIVAYGGTGIVDINEAGGVITVTGRIGDPNLARVLSPRDDAPSVPWTPAGPNLVWAPGFAGTASQSGVSHDVYFGTDDANVEDANHSYTEFIVHQDPCTHIFPLAPPVLGETYYWRIDEVNSTGPPTWTGEVWQFTMADYVVVEDFEYTSTDDLNDVWILTGSAIEVNETIVKPKSTKSMKYDFNNVDLPHYTEAVANTIGPNSLQLEPTVGRDWTTADIKALVVNFYGSAGNATTQMYVALKDTDSNTAVVYYDDLNDINEPEWHEWNIELNDFNDINKVNLSSIDKVYIGFGNRQTPAAGGLGTVYFDDIRLYITRCVVVYGPDGDVDEDCDVDLDDFSVMAGDWREKDSNRPGSDADVNGTWVNDGTRGRCIELDGIDDWVDLDDSDFSNFHNKTIAFWVKVMDYPDVYKYMFYFSDGADDPYRIYFMTYTLDGFLVRARFIEDYTTNYTAGLNAWTHLAFVLEDTPDGRCTGMFYTDGGDAYDPEGGTGDPYFVMPGRPRHSGGAVGVNIGSENDGTTKFVNALIDDFRVYDYALSGDEIKALYNTTKVPPIAGTTPDANMLVHYKFDETSGLIADNNSPYEFYHPLLSDAELDAHEAEGSRVIDFYDLAILVNDWLKEQLWPPLP